MRKPLGRPPLPKASRRSRRVTIYLTSDEYRTLMGGRKRGQAISDHLRDALLGGCQAAPQPSPPPPVASPPPVPADGSPRSMGPSSQHRASPQQQHGAPGAHQAQGRPYVAPPPPTTHGGGQAHGGPRSMGPSSQHRASPQQQHGAPGAHQAQSRPYIADPPPLDLYGPAPKAELVAAAKKVLATAWEEPIWAKGAQEIAERDPQLVLDVARESQALRHSAREGWFLLKARAGE